MEKTRGKYAFTSHALERWRERFPWKVRECGDNAARSLAIELYQHAKPDNSFLNDTAFTVYLCDQYGFDGGAFEYLVSSDAVFVVRGDAVVTVHRPGHRFRSQSGRFQRR